MTHILISGSPGEGKSRFLELMLAQLITKGDVVVVDSQGDQKLASRVGHMEIKRGCEKKPKRNA